jgi:outer membrane protein assembly factor BamB
MVLCHLAVIPVIIGPLQVLIAILPALLLSLAGACLALFKPSTMLALAKLLWRQKVALLLLALLVSGAVYAKRTYFPGARATTGLERGTDWPMFRGSLERRGANDAGQPPTSGGINWSYVADVKTFYASPALVGNRIYATSADKGPLTDRGAVYCLDADSGALDWKAAPDGYLATFSSPSIAGKYLVAGEGLHLTKSARIVCLDVSQRGKLLWTYATKSHVESTPCIYKDRVYVGAGDDGYYCFRLEPDAQGKAVLVWHAPTARCPDAETSPAVHDGKMFAGLGMGGNGIICLNADTGAQLWRVETPYPVFGPPTVINGAVIIGMGNGNFVETAEEVKRKELDKLRQAGKSEAELAAAEKTLGAAGEVWCLNAQTGDVQWKFLAADVILGAVAATPERLFFGARDGYVYALSPAGKLLGKWNANAPILTSPVVSGGHVYVVTESGMLYGLRCDDLERVWEARLGFTGPFISSPAVARGHVYVGSQQDGLLCLGQPGGQQLELRWDGFGGGSGRGGCLDGRPLPEKGKLGWRFPSAEGAEQAPLMTITAPPACLNGVLYVPVASGRNGLLCLREAARDKDAQGQELWFAATTNGVSLAPAATSNSVFFVDGKPGDQGRQLHCLSAADGKTEWTLPVSADGSGELVLTDDGGLLADGERLITFETKRQRWWEERGPTEYRKSVRLSAELEKKIRWEAPCGRVLGMPVVSEGLIVLATVQPAGLCVLDRPTGRELWRLPLDATPTAAPVLRKQTIFLGSPTGVCAVSLADGAPLWQAASGAPGAPLVLLKERLAYTTTSGELVILDATTGQVLNTITGVVPGFPPLAAPDALVYAGKSGLMACTTSGEEPRSWMKTDWLGRLTCAPVMADSRIYIATDKKGLLCLRSK